LSSFLLCVCTHTCFYFVNFLSFLLFGWCKNEGEFVKPKGGNRLNKLTRVMINITSMVVTTKGWGGGPNIHQR